MLKTLSYSNLCLNIQYGYGAFVVVREWESHSQGEGKQFINSKYIKERCVRHYEKSKDYFGKSTKTFLRR